VREGGLFCLLTYYEEKKLEKPGGFFDFVLRMGNGEIYFLLGDFTIHLSMRVYD